MKLNCLVCGYHCVRGMYLLHLQDRTVLCSAGNLLQDHWYNNSKDGSAVTVHSDDQTCYMQWLYIQMTEHVTYTIKIPSNNSWYSAPSTQLAVQKVLRPAILCVNCSVGSLMLFDNYLQPPAISLLTVSTQPTWLTVHTCHTSDTKWPVTAVR